MSCQSNHRLMQNRSGLSVTKWGMHNTQDDGDDDDDDYDDSADDEDGANGDDCGGYTGDPDDVNYLLQTNSWSL